jgi:hypothetical protein
MPAAEMAGPQTSASIDSQIGQHITISSVKSELGFARLVESVTIATEN